MLRSWRRHWDCEAVLLDHLVSGRALSSISALLKIHPVCSDGAERPLSHQLLLAAIQHYYDHVHVHVHVHMHGHVPDERVWVLHCTKRTGFWW